VAATVLKRVVEKQDLDLWLGRGWSVVRRKGNAISISRRIKKWEVLERSVRQIIANIGLSDTIDPDDFDYTRFGDYQLDACGGIEDHFVLIDCTSAEQQGLRDLKEKIKDFHNKQPDFERDIRNSLGSKYRHVHYAICTHDIVISDKDKEYAKSRNIQIIPYENLVEWVKLSSTRFPTLAFQFMEYFAKEPLPIPGGGPLRFPALRLPLAAESDDRYLYAFAASPLQLLRLAYVFRLGYKENEGYQRPLNVSKLRKINHFLSDDPQNGFPNNIIVAFDESAGRRLKFETAPGSEQNEAPLQVGVLEVPAYYGIAEVIDGQHRLYGYFDFSKDKFANPVLSERQQRDQLLVVAFPDPSRTERPRLFLDINSNQTKVSTRQIWAMMSSTGSGTHMGYVARLVSALNKKGPLKNRIQIPGETIGKPPVNIANFGKGIQDRHLVDRGEAFSWNLFDGVRGVGPYPDQPSQRVVQAFDDFFQGTRDASLADWTSGKNSFVLSNNGLNVLLRVYVEVLRYFRHDGKRVRIDRGKVRRILSPALSRYISREGPASLRKRTSTEAGREGVAREIMQEIRKRHRAFAAHYLEQH
jgi:DGQHR domain-containing protein